VYTIAYYLCSLVLGFKERRKRREGVDRMVGGWAVGEGKRSSLVRGEES
jgi:hypothetical protein